MSREEVNGVPKPMTKDEVCQFLGRSRPTIGKMIDRGELVATRPGRGKKTYIDPQSVADYISRGYER